MNSFRLSNKKIYHDERSSIENIHENKLESIEKYYNTLNDKKKKSY